MVSLADNALTTLEGVASELDGYTVGTDADTDDRVTRYINAASETLERMAGRAYHYVENHTEPVAGFGTRRLEVTDHLPVKTVDEVRLDDETIDSDAWEIEDANLGWIRRVCGRWKNTAETRRAIDAHHRAGTERRVYEVDYDGGYITPAQDNDGVGTRDLPWDVEQAVIAYVVMLWRKAGRDPMVSSESSLSESVSYRDIDGETVPVEFAHVIESDSSVGVA